MTNGAGLTILPDPQNTFMVPHALPILTEFTDATRSPAIDLSLVLKQ
jgi:hypothetical protein